MRRFRRENPDVVRYQEPLDTPDAVAAFVDLRWLDNDEPYYVPVPRVPAVGEIMVGPDGDPQLEVTEVSYVYESGFGWPPQVVVRTRPIAAAPLGFEVGP